MPARRLLTNLLCCVLLIILPISALAGEPPKISASGAVLLDARTGSVLFDKDSHKSLAPASTTKIMTAILAIESGKLDDLTTISAKAAAVEGSTVHLREGQLISIRELLHGLMLRSGNDSAIAIAEHVSGSTEAFVRLMNRKAYELGAYDTHFINPHGLPHPQHRSTAFDLAWIARYAMNNSTFADIVSTKYTSMDWQDARGQEHNRDIKNTNRLLWMLDEADGIKTGTTREAGPCLVASASHSGHRLIATVLHAAARWQDASILLHWGFDNHILYEYALRNDTIAALNVDNGMSSTVSAVMSRDAVMLLSPQQRQQLHIDIDLPSKIKAPVYRGQKIGEIRFSDNSGSISSFDLLASDTVEGKTMLNVLLHSLTTIFRFLGSWRIF